MMLDKETLKRMQEMADIVRRLPRVDPSVIRAAELAYSFQIPPLSPPVIQEMQRLAQRSQLLMDGFKFPELKESQALFRAVKEMSEAYTRLTGSLGMSRLPSSLAAQSAIVQIEQIRTVELLFPEQKTRVEPALEEATQQLFETTIEDIAQDTRDEIEQWLMHLRPSFCEMWQGARQAFASKGSDWPRQMMISLRTLLENLTKQLAPDEDVRAWSQNPHLYRENNLDNPPSGTGRISYICRHINDSSFAEFLKADIRVSVCLWQYLNRVHAVENLASETQLLIVLERFEATLRLLMHASLNEGL